MQDSDQSIVETHSIIKLRYRTLWIICLALLGVLVVLHGLSYFIVIPQRYILIFFNPLFLFQALVIMDYNLKSGNRPGKKRGEPLIKVHIKPWLGVVWFLLFIYFIFQFTYATSLGGAPKIENGQYVLNNRGEYTVISEEVYRKAVMAEARSSSAIFIAFLYSHFGYFFCKKTRRIPESSSKGKRAWRF